jgi:hypothetical protein
MSSEPVSEDPSKAERHGSTIKMMLKRRTPFVWLVFVTDESGPSGKNKKRGKNFDSGIHSANLNGIYTSEMEAQRHADALGDSVDEPNRQRRVQVVPVPIHHQFQDSNASKGPAWTFVANTDLEFLKSPYSTKRAPTCFYCI